MGEAKKQKITIKGKTCQRNGRITKQQKTRHFCENGNAREMAITSPRLAPPVREGRKIDFAILVTLVPSSLTKNLHPLQSHQLAFHVKGMSPLAKVFQNKKSLIIFITGGDPCIETTEKLIPEMADAGADIIEIGIPFSDPVAEGPVIQAASERALANGATTDKLLEMTARLRNKIQIPLVFMTYANPIYVYGKERFLSACHESGISGIIVPDMPFEEKGELSETCTKFGIPLISMVAPTSSERVAMIAKEAEGFLYCISSLGVTGMRSEINAGIEKIIVQAKKVTDVPCAIGFGISNADQARDMAKISDGVVVGSAIVKLIEKYGNDCIEPVKEFVRRMKDAIEKEVPCNL